MKCSKEFHITVNPGCVNYGKTPDGVFNTTNQGYVYPTYSSDRNEYYIWSYDIAGLIVLDGDTLAVKQTIDLSGYANTINYDGSAFFDPTTNRLYIACRGRYLFKYDFGLNVVESTLDYWTIPGITLGKGAWEIVKVGTKLYTFNLFYGYPTRIDPVTMTVEDHLANTTFSQLIYCPANNRIYASGRNVTGPYASPYGIFKFDPSNLSNNSQVFSLLDSFQITYSTVTQLLYLYRIPDGIIDEVEVINPVNDSELSVIPISAGPKPNSFAFLVSLGCFLYVFRDDGANSVFYQINPQNSTVQGPIIIPDMLNSKAVPIAAGGSINRRILSAAEDNWPTLGEFNKIIPP